MKNFILIIFLNLVCFSSKCQSWMLDTAVNSYGSELRKDPCNHIWTFGKDLPVLRKFTTSGNSLGQLNFSTNAQIKNVVCSKDSTVYVLGIYTGSLTIQSSTIISKGGDDIFIAKFNQNGFLLWLNSIGGKGNESAFGLCMNGKDIVITGSVEDTISINSQIFPVALPGIHELFVAKLFKNGTLDAIKLAIDDGSIPGESVGLEVVVDKASNIYVLTRLRSKIQIDTFTISHPQNGWTSYHALFLKFNSQLQLQWYYFETDKHVGCKNLQITNNNDLIYITNRPSWHSYKAGIHILSSSGALINQYNFKRKGWMHGLDLDSCGNAYLTGHGERSALMAYTPAYYFTLAQLSPSLKLNWLIEDSTKNMRGGLSIISPSVNKIYVSSYSGYSGYFHSILQTTPTSPSASLLAQSTICEGETIKLTASSPYLISWYSSLISTNAIMTGSNYITPPLNSGIHTWFVGASSCSVTTGRTAISVTVSACTDLQEGNLNDVIKFYPNPSRDHVTFELKSNSEFMIYNALGKLVLKGNLPEGKNKIDLNDLSNGVYIVKLSSADKEITKKLMLDR
jgi:hypothetical protein